MLSLTLRMQLSPIYVHWRILSPTGSGTQEIIVLTGTAIVCKHSVTSKQEGRGLIGVCVGVWITLLQLILAEEPIQLQLGERFQIMGESHVCYHPEHYVHMKKCVF